MTSAQTAQVDRFNLALEDPCLRAALRLLAASPQFRSRLFIERLQDEAGNRSIAIGSLVQAAAESGVALSAASMTMDDLNSLTLPALVYLTRSTSGDIGDLVQVLSIDNDRVALSEDKFGSKYMPSAEFKERWNGLTLWISDLAKHSENMSELDLYDQEICLSDDILTADQCRELISYCEKQVFQHSRVAQRNGITTIDAIDADVRSSSSAVLEDRNHPVLKQLYKSCSLLEGVPEENVETIQCVRYGINQKYRSHFDGGLKLPRLTTYLLYLNDDFTGGETYFPVLNRTITPKAGSWLKFASCSPDGRILWLSEHGGLPVTSGFKYALNIWVRTGELDRTSPSERGHSLWA